MKKIYNDSPINSRTEDLLGRAKFADNIYEILLSMFKNNESQVFGLYGEWGNGKTSVINLVKERYNEFIKNKTFLEKQISSIKNFNCSNSTNIIFSFLVKLAFFTLFICKFKFNSVLHPDFIKYYFSITNIGIEIFKNFIIFLIFCCLFNLPTIKLDYLCVIPKKIIYIIFSVFNKNKLSVKILDFTPWSFENEQSIVKDFFNLLNNELSLNNHIKKDVIGKIIQNYANKITGIKEKDDKTDILSLKEEIKKTLSNSNTKFIIFIDDIDRLDNKSVLTVFKLIKSIADLPNIIYFLSFDRDVICQKLEAEKINGEDYLEKIIPLSINMPKIKPDKLEQYINKEFSRFINTYPELRDFWEEKYKSKFEEYKFNGLYEPFTNIRKVKKIINALFISYTKELQKEVNIVDFIVITILGLNLPKLYNFIYKNRTFLTRHHQYANIETNEINLLKKELEEAISENKLFTEENLRHVLIKLFPNFSGIFGSFTGSNTFEYYRDNKNICCSDCFYEYFVLDILENKISQKEMEGIVDESLNLKSFYNSISNIINNNKLTTFLYQLQTFTRKKLPPKQAINILKAFIYQTDFIDDIRNDIYNDSYHKIVLNCIEIFKNTFNNTIPDRLITMFKNSKCMFMLIFLTEYILDKNKTKLEIDEKTKQKLINITIEKISILANNDLNKINNAQYPCNGHLYGHEKLFRILAYWKRENKNTNLLNSYLQYVYQNNEIILRLLNETQSYVYDGHKQYCMFSLRNFQYLYVNISLEELKNRILKINDSALQNKKEFILETIKEYERDLEQQRKSISHGSGPLLC